MQTNKETNKQKKIMMSMLENGHDRMQSSKHLQTVSILIWLFVPCSHY